ncbi:MAG: DUF192 domain-containing protein [Anaerolineales bacterium]|nr:DUF192 domain-containing protein [Anaerolineales bacterium]
MTKLIRVINKSRDIESSPRVEYCDTFLTQLRGLTFRPLLPRDGGLVLVGRRDSRLDSSIHMLFVSFDLCVVWINAEMKVVDKILARSWKPAYFSKYPAKFVLEIDPDRWGDFEIGDAVEFQNA